MSSQRIKVILNPDREEDRRILDYLHYSGLPKSKVLKMAMLQLIDSEYESNSHKELLREVRKAVREELRSVQPLVIDTFAQPVSDSDREEDVSPLDFLDQLAEMAPD